MHTVTIDNITIGPDQPLALIAGPCVLESRDIAFTVAEAVRRLTDELGIPYIFKASFDKANRTSISSYRGPGLDAGLEILAAVRKEFDVPVCTDFHEPAQAAPVAEVVDLLQVPAFLCRQTDMLLAAADTGKPVSVKKAQFLAPWDMKNVVEKFTAGGNHQLLLTERGATFGYNNLMVDMRSLRGDARAGLSGGVRCHAQRAITRRHRHRHRRPAPVRPRPGTRRRRHRHRRLIHGSTPGAGDKACPTPPPCGRCPSCAAC